MTEDQLAEVLKLSPKERAIYDHGGVSAYYLYLVHKELARVAQSLELRSY